MDSAVQLSPNFCLPKVLLPGTAKNPLYTQLTFLLLYTNVWDGFAALITPNTGESLLVLLIKIATFKFFFVSVLYKFASLF